MKTFAATSLVLASACIHAQSSDAGATLLERARHAQDAPFTRGLQAFTCRVDFNWPQHFQEAPRVGDEGTDEQIRALIQPIKTRVTVSSRGAMPASNLTESDEHNLPNSGVAEGLLKHAVQFSLNQWLMAANDSLLPPPGTSATAGKGTNGIHLHFAMQATQAEALLTPDLRLQQIHAEDDDTDRIETRFAPGPNGFTLTSLAVGEDGRFASGNRIIVTYDYQTVSGFQLPADVVLNRESHHETWHYKLAGCSVVTSK